MKNRSISHFLLIFLFGGQFFPLFSQPGNYEVDALVHPMYQQKTIVVGGEGADIGGFSDLAIQAGINQLGPGGGTIQLTSGLFILNAPVSLKSNLKLIGTGEKTILKKGPGVQTRFILDADYAELKITVEDAGAFEPGMRIQVTDEDHSGCWNVSTANITTIEGNVIYIDKGLIRDYRADRNGLISNACSVVEVIGSENVVISDLVIDGNSDQNFFADGCNSAGVLIIRSKNVMVEGVAVRDFKGEGISWQITENVTVKNSEIFGCANNGLHPGTGSPLTSILNNDVHHNGNDGLFICWRVHHSEVKGNKFHHNNRFGICTGHKDTDVLFEGNHVYENGSDGIHLRRENESNAPHRNLFRNNTIENNGQIEAGYGFSVNSPAREVVLKDNVIRDNQKGSQKSAIFIYKNGVMPTLENNSYTGHPQNNIDTESDK